MASSTFFIPSVNVIGADSLTDAMNMMADYGFTRTLIVTDRRNGYGCLNARYRSVCFYCRHADH